MRTLEAKNFEEATRLMEHLNHCHDGSMRKLCFYKKRKVDRQDGSLIYPFESIEGRTICNVEAELILNSYLGAKKGQIVLLQFQKVTHLTLIQLDQSDYSEIYEAVVKKDRKSKLKVTFYSTEEKIPTLTLSCERIVCIGGGDSHWDRGPIKGGRGQWPPDGITWYPK